MRFRAPALLVPALAVALGLAACGDDDDDAASTGTTEAVADETTTTAAEQTTTSAPEEEPPAEDATIAVGETDLGAVLVDAEGFTLYLFTNDTGSTSTCTGGCADTWPAVVADSPTGGEGVDAGLLATSARDDGTNQVTYNGHPLYRFAPDEAPGDANGQGIGGVWFVVDASGNAVQ